MHSAFSYQYHSISLSLGTSPVHFPQGSEHLHLTQSWGQRLWMEAIYEEGRRLRVIHRFIVVRNKASPDLTHF